MPLRRRLLRLSAALAGAVLITLLAILLPLWVTRGRFGTSNATPPTTSPQGPVALAGALHVHTNASHDASLELERAVAEARAAGLAFLIITDHDVPPPAPRARIVDGVLVVWGTEWSNKDGHLLDLSPSPGRGGYSSAAEALADCRARGGPCIAAHPTSRRRPYAAPMEGLDGVEVQSAMTSLGDLVAPPYVDLAAMGMQVVGDPAAALWSVGAANASAVEVFENMARGRRVFAACGADAHGNLPLRENLLGFVTLVDGDTPLPADAEAAARVLVERLGHASCVNMMAGRVDGLQLRRQDGQVHAETSVRSAHEARLRLSCNGQERAEAELPDGQGSLHLPDENCVWRAEVVVAARGVWGTVERSAAIRFLPVP